ncbi:hypothetical protein SODALDRAFT_328653 [Sodiomyces alkalinus F11]|uniref:Uncharacterized protein n=1 Tax=Sodiomyces alkalinus (strain CBS 110278 / VKM F-3762 / F11) TaxID=1314773 RepID=A0A3N2PLB7_SODAK|nr:hypothetical protein SODALDRAFT_328653 [Sodiomyces alkalinus F11]ROT35331.1 hypothetical protein SODALDRAFT_328653 [Sodiomyces alkalinus F11]
MTTKGTQTCWTRAFPEARADSLTNDGDDGRPTVNDELVSVVPAVGAVPRGSVHAHDWDVEGEVVGVVYVDWSVIVTTTVLVTFCTTVWVAISVESRSSVDKRGLVSVEGGAGAASVVIVIGGVIADSGEQSGRNSTSPMPLIVPACRLEVDGLAA